MAAKFSVTSFNVANILSIYDLVHIRKKEKGFLKQISCTFCVQSNIYRNVAHIYTD